MSLPRYQTPLRYPGGKQRLAKFFEELLAANQLVGGDYVEPYAGGAGIALELLRKDVVGKVHLNDASRAIFAFWDSVLNETDTLVRLIHDATLSIEEWRSQREILRRESEFDLLSVGFAFFYLNRCNRSGIPNGGVIGGLQQTGKWKIDARFNKAELIRRIEAVASWKSRINLTQLDAEIFIKEHLPKLSATSLVYLDPPYYVQGNRLYLHHYAPKDHTRVATLVQASIQQPWVVSYDAAPAILRLYVAQPKRITYGLQYSAAQAYRGREVMVFSKDLIVPTASQVTSMNRSLGQLTRRVRERSNALCRST